MLSVSASKNGQIMARWVPSERFEDGLFKIFQEIKTNISLNQVEYFYWRNKGIQNDLLKLNLNEDMVFWDLRRRCCKTDISDYTIFNTVVKKGAGDAFEWCGSTKTVSWYWVFSQSISILLTGKLTGTDGDWPCSLPTAGKHDWYIQPFSFDCPVLDWPTTGIWYASPSSRVGKITGDLWLSTSDSRNLGPLDSSEPQPFFLH